MIEKTKKLNVTAQKQIKQIKIGLVGDAGTGKSSFLTQYIFGQFKQQVQTTLGVQTFIKTIQNPNGNGSTINITFWDFSGKLDFVEIRNQFYKEVDVILLFCDLSSKNSIQSIQYWIRQGKDNGAPMTYIIGNKSDIKKVNDVQKISKDKGCAYFQVSAKTGDGIKQLMKKLFNEVK